MAFSPAMRERSAQLKRFLHAGLYRIHGSTRRSAARAASCGDCSTYAAEPSRLPDEHRVRVDAIGLRAVADYVPA